MDKARTLNDILDIEDSELVLDSLDCFTPPQRIAIELFIVYCCGSNMVAINNDDILKPSEITVELIIEIFHTHYSDSLVEMFENVNDVPTHVHKEFQKIFVKKG